MKNLKFKEGAFSNVVCKGQHAFEQYSYDELFEPMELEGVACDYKEIKAGDWFVWEHEAATYYFLKLKLNTGHAHTAAYAYYDGSYYSGEMLSDKEPVINLGELTNIPEKFTIKIKEPENKAKQKEPVKVTYLVCKKCSKIIDVIGDGYHNEQHDSYIGEVSGNYFYTWTCPECKKKPNKPVTFGDLSEEEWFIIPRDTKMKYQKHYISERRNTICVPTGGSIEEIRFTHINGHVAVIPLHRSLQ